MAKSGISSIGKLDELITIESEVTTVNDHNEPVGTGVWTRICRTWATVADDQFAANKEYLISDQITAKRTINITIRYRDDLDERMRVYRKGKYYNIIAISQPDRNKSTLLRAELIDEL